MKRILLLSCALALLFITSFSALAQRVRIISGDPGILNSVRKVNVVYDYSTMDVGKETEKEYVAAKRTEYNNKENGKGDKWAQEWVNDRHNRFEPQFEDQFNKRNYIIIGNYPAEKYTMIVKTVFTEPGFNVGIVRRSAYIDLEIWIVETTNQNNVLAKLTCSNCPGRSAFGYDFATGERIQEAYAAAGKTLASYLERRFG